MIQSKRLVRLIRDLSHHNASKRRSAAEALAKSDERAIYPLIKALKDENAGVQDAAMRSLISLGGEVTAYMVLPLLREDAFLRNTATIILKEIGAPAVPLFVSFLRDKDPDVRKFALDLIGEIRECDYCPEIANLLQHDPNPNVRASAAKVIGVLQYRDALPQLIAALGDDEWVCFSAIESLAAMYHESSLESIEKLLESPSDALRYAAIETLGKIGMTRSADALINHMTKAEGFEKEATLKSLIQIGVTPSVPGGPEMLLEMFTSGDWEDKRIALKGLVALQETRAIYPLIDMAGSLDPSEPENEERLLHIKEALRSFGCSESLIAVLNNPSLKYRGKAIAIEVIGDLRCTEAVPHLIRFFEGDVRDVRRASMRALLEIGEKEIKDTLVDAIDDYDGHVRRMAVAALGRIGDRASFEPILKLLLAERYADVKEEAVRALLMIDPAALSCHLHEFDGFVKEVIGKCSEDVDILLSLLEDRDLSVRVAALTGLGKIQDERVCGRLAWAMRAAEPEVRKAAIAAMSEHNCYHDEIKSALADDDQWVRMSAVNALGESFRKDMINNLIPMVEDGSLPVVLSAIAAISRIGGREAFSILSSLTNHGVEAVREKACEAIQGLRYAGD